jgi:phosphatidylglycerophosphate synthase
MRRRLQLAIYKIINPVVKLLIRMGLTPNMITTIGLALNIGVAVIFICGAGEGRRGDLSYVGWAGALILFAGLFDMLDGQVARLGNMSSPFGALYDSVLDRYSELILFLGICYYLVSYHYFISSIFAFLGLIGSMMVSYTRARAEGLGIECKEGLMQRPERIVILGASALACGIASHWIGGAYKIPWPDEKYPIFESISVFTIPITLIAILANITAIRRLRDARRALEARARTSAAVEKTNGAMEKTTETMEKTSGTMELTSGTIENTSGIMELTSGTTENTSGTMELTSGTTEKTSGTKAKTPGTMAVLLLAALSAISGTAQPSTIRDPVDTFPVPPTNANSLFYLQRTPNTNTIICELNLTNGRLDQDEPVKVLWIRYTEQHQRQELTWIQRHFAYGLRERDLGNGVYELRFVSYRKIPMYLMRSPVDNRHHVYVTIQGRQAILNRVYIRIDPGGTFWSPNVKYLELKGVDVQTGAALIERINV